MATFSFTQSWLVACLRRWGDDGKASWLASLDSRHRHRASVTWLTNSKRWLNGNGRARPSKGTCKCLSHAGPPRQSVTKSVPDANRPFFPVSNDAPYRSRRGRREVPRKAQTAATLLVNSTSLWLTPLVSATLPFKQGEVNPVNCSLGALSRGSFHVADPPLETQTGSVDGGSVRWMHSRWLIVALNHDRHTCRQY